MTRINAKATLVAVALSAASVLPAAATTVSVSQQNPYSLYADASGRNHWVQTVAVTANGNSWWPNYFDVNAGMMRIKTTDDKGAVKAVNAFCLELLQGLRLPSVYDTVKETADGSNVVADRLGKLVANARDLVKDARTAAAFQLAAWEITTEKASTKLSLTGGNFRAYDYNFGYTTSLAQNWLDKVTNGWTDKTDFMKLVSAKQQDLLTDIPVPADPVDPAPVPLPAAAWLLGGALAGLGALRRKKAA